MSPTSDADAWWRKYQIELPPGRSGDFEIRRVVVSEDEARFDQLRARMHWRRGIRPGTYTALYERNSLWMSDGPDEIADHLDPIYEAQRRKGHGLVNGLGIGMVSAAMLDAGLERLTVVERSKDVIELVAPTLRARFGDRIEVVEGDAFEWKPPKGQRYSVVWHDVWIALSGDNIPEMTRLHRRYGRRADWQGSWGLDWLRAHARRAR